jgi:hypothetical protein
LFDDKNSDSVGTKEEQVAEQPLTHFFGVDDSATFTFSEPSVSPGSHRFSVRLILPGDEDTTDNTLSKKFFIGYSPRSVLVNEIMYAPSSGPEWIECVNNSADTISLSQWKIGDNTASRGTMNSQSRPFFPGNSLSWREILQFLIIIPRSMHRLSKLIFLR